jgi:hypothetical protein
MLTFHSQAQVELYTNYLLCMISMSSPNLLYFKSLKNRSFLIPLWLKIKLASSMFAYFVALWKNLEEGNFLIKFYLLQRKIPLKIFKYSK